MNFQTDNQKFGDSGALIPATLTYMHTFVINGKLHFISIHWEGVGGGGAMGDDCIANVDYRRTRGPLGHILDTGIRCFRAVRVGISTAAQ